MPWCTVPTIVPEPGDAWLSVRDALAFSSVRTREETGTLLVHIGRSSSAAAAAVSPGESVVSGEVTAGDRTWRLLY
ncbi:hypothetical protein ACP4OV_001945 [Aristida adscensionis]